MEKAGKKITETYNFSEKNGDYFRFNKFEDDTKIFMKPKIDKE